MSFVSEYRDLLVKQYWEKTKAKAEITLQAETWQQIFDWLNSFEEAFDIDSATGDRLDIIGRVVGISRSVPSILVKVFFGFDDNPNVTGFDEEFEELGDLGPFFSKFSSQYSDLQLNDNDFRFFIKAKITKNSAHGVMTTDYFTSIQDAIIVLFDGLAYVEDNKDMSLTLHINSLVDDDRVRIISQLDIVPRPQGVRYFIVQSNYGDTFGFDDNVNNKGFKNKFDPVVEAGGYFQRKLI